MDELTKIDITPIDALKALKDERDVLDGRIAAMDEKKGSVAEAVYQRVRADYLARRDAIEAQAQPLRAQGREQYAQLKTILARLEADHEAVTLDRQEVEFRHQLGEYDKKEFERRVKAIEAQVTEKEQWRQKALELKARFLAAVRDESEYDAPSPAPAAPAAAPAAYSTNEMPAIAPTHLGTVTHELAKPPPPSATMVMPAIKLPPAGGAPAAPAPPPGAVMAESGTMVIPSFKMPPPPATPAAPAAPAPGVGDATVMFRPARLVPQNPEAGKATLPLGIKPVMIGSDAGNDVRVAGAGVEPKHAQITPTVQGYMLVDLDTKAGTRVNAERIRERLLQNEDVVQVGAARFVFRAS